MQENFVCSPGAVAAKERMRKEKEYKKKKSLRPFDNAAFFLSLGTLKVVVLN
jgi:hypothetical protein